MREMMHIIQRKPGSFDKKDKALPRIRQVSIVNIIVFVLYITYNQCHIKYKWSTNYVKYSKFQHET